MLPAKLAYFIEGARYEIVTYFILFYLSTGLTPSQAGLVNGLQYIGGVIGNPLWSTLADSRGCHRIITILLCTMATIAICTQPYLGARFGDRNTCPLKQDVSQFNKSNSSFNLQHGNIETDRSNKGTLFYSLLVASVTFSSFECSITSFVDAGVLRRLETTPTESSIGMQRFANLVGASFGSFAYSLSIEYFPRGKLSCYDGLFVTYFAFAVCTGLAYCLLHRGIATTKDGSKDERFTTLVISHLKNPHTLFFLGTVLFSGIAQSLYFSFIFIYLKELHAPILLFAMSVGVNSLSGIIVSILSNNYIKWLGGPMNAMCLSCLAWAARFLATAVISNPFYVLVIDIFHGFTYSLAKVSSLQYIKEITDVRIFTTMCAITNLLFLSFSFLISNIVGGMLYEGFGGKKLFIGACAACTACSLVIAVYLLVRKLGRTNLN